MRSLSDQCELLWYVGPSEVPASVRSQQIRSGALPHHPQPHQAQQPAEGPPDFQLLEHN